MHSFNLCYSKIDIYINGYHKKRLILYMTDSDETKTE